MTTAFDPLLAQGDGLALSASPRQMQISIDRTPEAAGPAGAP
jgi:hypothetical protein